MNTRRRTLAALLVTPVALSVSGCIFLAGAAIGAGAGAVAYKYSKGEGAKTYGYTLPRVEPAACDSLRELGFTPTDRRSDDVSARIEGKTIDNKDIKVKIERVSESATKVSIRVGTFGDESVTKAIFDHIDAHLPPPKQ